MRVCKAYRLGEEEFEDFPPHQSIFHRAEALFEDLEGWPEELADVRAFADLPMAAQRYVRRLEELGGVPVRYVSVGADREQTLAVREAG